MNDILLAGFGGLLQGAILAGLVLLVRYFKKSEDNEGESANSLTSPGNSIADRAMQRKASQKMVCPNCAAEYDGYQMVCLKCRAKLVAIDPTTDESGKNE